MSLAVGAHLGPYEILAPIGAGGMGEVYRAKDPRLGREVAIKVLPASFASDPDRLKRFEQEARAAGVLNHPNVTIVYDIGSHEGAPYVVQELLEGETLRSELAGGKFSTRKAIDFAIQIAQGLAAAHEKGIVHRDLKPENLFVTKDGRIKILDFGLAKLTQLDGSASATNIPTATEPGLVMGTLGYMSPEQVNAKPADARSDIFALGAVLYEMLSGNRAFRGDSTASIMVTILKEDPSDLSATNRDVSPGLERIVRHCLEKNPERRFQSAGDLAFDLETVSAVSGAAPAVAPGARSRRWRVPVVAAAVLGVGGLAGWGINALKKSPPLPSYTRITFRRGTVYSARFAPDGKTIVYSAAWEGQPARIFATRVGSLESRQLPLPDGRILAVSPSGELAIQIGRETVWESTGTLARVPLEGGAPRELLENVLFADWSPDGRDLAVVHRVGGKYRIEFPIGKVLYETPQPISSMRFSPRGDRLAITQGVEEILSIDLAGKATPLVKGWKGIGNVAWRPDGEEIWFGGQKGSEEFRVYAVTPSGRERLVRREAAGLFFHDISREGRVLLNDYFWDSNLAALPTGETTERDLSWMDRSFVDAISSDGRFVVFTEWGQGGGENGTIYLRPIDGSAAVRLGEGYGRGLSPDGRWVLSELFDQPDAYQLVPTGPGQPRRLEHRGLRTVPAGRFLPDGKSMLFLAWAGNGPLKAYVQSLEGGEPRAISSEGLSGGSLALSPDGRSFAALGPDSRIAIYPMEGGAPKPIAGAEAGEIPILWSSDGRMIYVYKGRQAPALVFKVDVANGARELWKTVAPADRSGLVEIDGIVMTPDARSYAFCYERILTSLQVVEGLR